MGFRNRLAQFFYGRNGVDALYYANFVVFLFVAVLRLFITNTIVGIVFYVIEAVLLFIMIFRMLSRNVAKRRKENQIFLNLFKYVKNWFVLQKNRIRDFKKCRYRKCTACQAVLRLPIKKGKHTVCCPRCKKRFEVRVLF